MTGSGTGNETLRDLSSGFSWDLEEELQNGHIFTIMPGREQEELESDVGKGKWLSSDSWSGGRKSISNL